MEEETHSISNQQQHIQPPNQYQQQHHDMSFQFDDLFPSYASHQNLQQNQANNNTQSCGENDEIKKLQKKQQNQIVKNMKELDLNEHVKINLDKYTPLRKRKRPIHKQYEHSYHKDQHHNHKDKQILKLKHYERAIKNLQNRINQLENQLSFYKLKQKQDNSLQALQIEEVNPQKAFLLEDNLKNVPSSKTEVPQFPNTPTPSGGLEFQQMDFNTLIPVSNSPEMQQKSWILLGTVLIVMGSQMMNCDGTINIYKILKQAADQVRRQVQKCQENINLEFFLSKEDIPEFEIMQKQAFNFDPFFEQGVLEEGYKKTKGFQAEGVRVQSVRQSQLYFTQKINYTVRYQSLLKISEYMKKNSWFMQQLC